jgi:hypothetical protein
LTISKIRPVDHCSQDSQACSRLLNAKGQVGMSPGKDQLNKAEASLDQQSNY